MEIKISGHNYQYDVSGMSLLFFPGEPVCFKTYPRGALRLSSRVVNTTRGLYARATFWMEESVYRAEKKMQNHTREEMLAAVKHTIYRVFSRATGILPPWGILTGIKPTGIYQRLLAEKGALETRRILLKEYLMRPEKIPLLHQICRVMETVQTDCSKEASLYISIPFCPSRCSYCSFISVAAERCNHLMELYLEKLCGEIHEKCRVLNENGLSVRAVYIGGGTPGILSPQQIEKLLSVIRSELKAPLREFTFELGRPDTVTEEKLRLLKSFGVSRICINTQTTNDRVLEQIGRKHTRAQYLHAVSLTRKMNFDSINTDLIAGLPGEDEASFARSLEDVLKAGADNITIHTLSIKRSSRLHETPDYFDPRNDHVQRMLDRAFERLLRLGFIPYYMYRQKKTVSNGENVGFARPETICLYNLYMMEDLHTVAACGAGASTKIISGESGRIERIINVKYPFEYIGEYEKVRHNTHLLEQKLKERT